MPCLVLNYFGQGALVLADASAVANPFFMMTPDWALLPLVVLATAATVIASQALISGAFSATKQTIQLGFLPRLSILHTSIRDTGQIYIPAVNWALLVGVVVAVTFSVLRRRWRRPTVISVSLVMVITTLLTFFVLRYGWGYPLLLCIAATGFFLAIDLLFFASNALKIVQGGWFPLTMAAALYVVMTTWKEGRALLNARLRQDALKLRDFSRRCFCIRPRASMERRFFSLPSRASCPTRSCTTSSTTRFCTGKICSSPCATTRCPGSAWTSASRSSRWGATAGR